LPGTAEDLSDTLLRGHGRPIRVSQHVRCGQHVKELRGRRRVGAQLLSQPALTGLDQRTRVIPHQGDHHWIDIAKGREVGSTVQRMQAGTREVR
jgi:hypothetical protein